MKKSKKKKNKNIIHIEFQLIQFDKNRKIIQYFFLKLSINIPRSSKNPKK